MGWPDAAVLIVGVVACFGLVAFAIWTVNRE